MLGVAAALLIVMVLAGGALIYDGGRALVAQRQIINVAEGAARAGTNTTTEGGLQQGPATAAVTATLRTTVPGPGPDRHLSPEIEAAVALVASGAVRAAAEQATGPLA